MANTKITTNVIADGAITSAKLDSSSLAIPSTATATTQSAGDNSTKVATTAYVETAVSNLVSAAPAALDTLDELAAALGDDANFSTTITNSLALKAPLASPDFTGDVTFDTSTLVIDSTNNRVGIGTTNPQGNLHISSGSSKFRLTDTGITDANHNTLVAFASGQNKFALGVSSTTGTSTDIVIDGGNDRVGIGIGNPAEALDVNGNIQTDDTLIFNNGAVRWQHLVSSNEYTLRYNGGAWNEYFRVDVDGNVGIGTDNPSTPLHVKTNSSGYALTLEENSGGEVYQLGTDSFGGLAIFNSGTKVADFADSSEFQLYDSGAVKAKISPTGNSYFTDSNVGIGITGHNKKLHVSFDESSTTSFDNGIVVGNTNTGTGTLAPILFSTDSGNRIRSAIAHVDTTSYGAGDLVFYLDSDGQTSSSVLATSDEKMRITRGGNVGIGTSSPSVALDVNGEIKFGLSNTFTSVSNAFRGDGTNGAMLRSAISTAANPSFANSDDQDTGMFTPGSDVLGFTTGGSEAMRIDNNGDVMINNTAAASVGGRLTVVDAFVGLNNSIMNTSFTGTAMLSTSERSASSAYFFFAAVSGRRVDNASGDTEFSVRGDGEVFADGGAINTGADYAEYFEWQDGNPDNEDRVGYAVSLVGNKIKIAEAGEEVIGVISGNPSVVGDAAWNKWQHKYLKDDFGRYLWEEYADEDGNTTDDNGDLLKRRVLNPDYDDSLEYQPREDRQEWDVVGLMGKLRVRVGQQTNSNWIKLQDISDTVEEWLVK